MPAVPGDPSRDQGHGPGHDTYPAGGTRHTTEMRREVAFRIKYAVDVYAGEVTIDTP